MCFGWDPHGLVGIRASWGSAVLLVGSVPQVGSKSSSSAARASYRASWIQFMLVGFMQRTWRSFILFSLPLLPSSCVSLWQVAAAVTDSLLLLIRVMMQHGMVSPDRFQSLAANSCCSSSGPSSSEGKTSKKAKKLARAGSSSCERGGSAEGAAEDDLTVQVVEMLKQVLLVPPPLS